MQSPVAAALASAALLLGAPAQAAQHMIAVCTGAGVKLVAVDAGGKPVEDRGDGSACAHLWCGSRRRAGPPATD